jgi:hypothetical protein
MEIFIQLVMGVIGIVISIGFISFISTYQFSKMPNYFRWVLTPILFLAAFMLSRVLFGSFFNFMDGMGFLTFERLHYYFLLIIIYPMQSVAIPFAQVFASVYTVAKVAPKIQKTIGYAAAIICLIPLGFSFFLVNQSSISIFMYDELYFFLTNASEYSNTPFWAVIHIIFSLIGSIAAVMLLQKGEEPFNFLLEEEKLK